MNEKQTTSFLRGERLTDVDTARRILLAVVRDDSAGEETGDGGARATDLPSIPGYIIDGLLGMGGGGAVYRGRMTASARFVAVKILHRSLGDDRGERSAQRAWRELHVLSQIRLPCLPTLLDFGEVEGRLYITTEFVDGRSLIEYCESKDLSCSERVELLAAVSDAVHALHELGVIHRDIKPTNILVNALDQPIIIDLGIAMLLADSAMDTLTAQGTPLGSPAFMSPEQARGERQNVSTRSDVYGLGATAYLVLTGQTPHDTSATIHEVVRRVAQDQPRDPRSLDASLAKPLAAVLRKAVCPRPEDRYSSAAHFASDLRRWLNHDPVEAAVQSFTQRLARTMSRHPVAATVITCIAIAALSMVLTIASVIWVNDRPYKIRISADRSVVSLEAYSGRPLHEWDTEVDDGVIFARMLTRPDDAGGERIIVIGFKGNGRKDHSGKLCLYRLDDLDSPFWSSGTHPPYFEMPEEISNIGPERFFQVSWAAVEEVFAESPGPEIIAVHRHSPNSANVIRVYDLHGEVRYEVWHDGHILDGYWMADARTLFFCGVNSEGGWAGRGYPDLETGIPPLVVFAVRPKWNGINCDWIHTPDGGGLYEPLWYRCVLPPIASDIFGVSPHGFQLARPQDSLLAESLVKLAIHEENPPRAGLSLFIDADGREVAEHRFVNDAYSEHEEWPASEIFRLGELPAKMDDQQ